MSSIIDDFIQIKYKEIDHLLPDNIIYSSLEDLTKKVNITHGCSIVRSSIVTLETYSQIQLSSKQYLIRLKSSKKNEEILISASQMDPSYSKKVKSSNVQKELIKELSAQQYQFQGDALYYLLNGRIEMSLKLYLCTLGLSRKKFIDLYSQIIIKNVDQYHKFLSKIFKDPKALVSDQEKQNEYHQDLTVSLIANTEANFDYSEAKSQFTLSQANLKKQKLQLRTILENIQTEKQLERNIDSLYQFRLKQSSSGWVKDNLMHYSGVNHQKFKNSLTIKYLGDRKIDDFVFNVVKPELKEKSSKPIAEGGSSYIYSAKVILNFVNSFDFTAHKAHDQKVQKRIALKVIKGEHQEKLMAKLQHQKKIVVKLRGSVTYFLPKYYGSDDKDELNNCLMMELINGESLDDFTRLNRLTLSFRTKLYLLLNILYGIRHLISYQIVHLDIKPINILVCKQFVTKIIDFGEAYNHQVCSKDYCPGFTFPYVAPEIYNRYYNRISNKKEEPLQFSQKQDVFAFGVIMYELLFNNKIFEFNPKKYKEIYYSKLITSRIFLGIQKLQDYGNNFMLSSFVYLIMRCLEADPEKRPKFDWIGVLLKIMLKYYKSH